MVDRYYAVCCDELVCSCVMTDFVIVEQFCEDEGMRVMARLVIVCSHTLSE